MRPAHGLGLALLATASFACSSDDGGPDGSTPGADAGVVDSGAGASTAPEFTVEVVEGLGSGALVGDFAQAVRGPEGRFVIAYGYVPAGGGEREIHYGQLGTDGQWSTELAVVPGAAIPGGDDLKGLGFDIVGGVPHLAYLGGDDDGRATVEEPTDLVLATRGAGGWTERTLVDVSTEATGDCSEYCNQGFVVGSHAALRADPAGTGFAVVYRDTHIGFAVDDLALADVELYSEGGAAPRNSVVDAERGGGEHANITFTAEGAPFVAYSLASEDGITDDTGVWAAVFAAGVWQRRKVWTHRASSRVGVAVTPDGALHVALYDTGDSDLVVASSSDGGDTWRTERVESAGKTGLFPSAAVDAAGRLVVSYTYCGPSADRSCPDTLGPDAEVRLARKEASGWEVYSVDDGQGFGRVGLFTTLAVDAEGKLGIGFVDDGNGDLLFAKEQ